MTGSIRGACPEVAVEELLCDGLVTELFIAFGQFGFLFRSKPVLCAPVEEGFGLCVELRIVDVGRIVYRFFDLYTDKATVAGDISQ
ncbi:MAG: hypothetical protein LUG51_07875 [Tannerellaceae bacterium]|nr:hypothetical protein [Tannerellaceae bacterium]